MPSIAQLFSSFFKSVFLEIVQSGTESNNDPPSVGQDTDSVQDNIPSMIELSPVLATHVKALSQ